jgi:4-amino-4-deoxy-L-arabinose transferase-like glycosyltransferase
MTRWIEQLRNRPEVLALIIGVAAHAVILFGVLPAASTFLKPLYGIGFADNYNDLALSLLNGHGYRFSPETAPTMMREPGYPMILAAAFSLFGYSVAAAQALNLLLTVATALLLIRIVRGFTTDRRVIAAAVVLFLAHPGTILAEARGGFEMTYAFCLLLFTWRFAQALNTRRMLDYLWAGGALGLTTLVRSSVIVLPIIALVWFLFRPGAGRPRRQVVIEVLVLSLGMCVVISPWVIRNYLLVHTLMPTATVSGIAFQTGEYVCRNRNSGRPLQDVDYAARLERGKIARAAGYHFEDNFFPLFFSARDELEFSRDLTKRVVSYYQSNPAVFLQCATANLVNFWIAGKRPWVTRANALVQIPYFLLALVGAVWLARRAGGSSYVTPIVLLICLHWAVSAVSMAQARYTVPLVPLLAVLAAQPLRELWARAYGRAGQSPASRGESRKVQ